MLGPDGPFSGLLLSASYKSATRLQLTGRMQPQKLTRMNSRVEGVPPQSPLVRKRNITVQTVCLIDSWICDSMSAEKTQKAALAFSASFK